MEREGRHEQPSYQKALSRYEQAFNAYQAGPSEETLRRLRGAMGILLVETQKPGRFKLGDVYLTPGAIDALSEAKHIPEEFLLRHKHGDWGELDPEDVRENERSLGVVNLSNEGE